MILFSLFGIFKCFLENFFVCFRSPKYITKFGTLAILGLMGMMSMEIIGFLYSRLSF